MLAVELEEKTELLFSVVVLVYNKEQYIQKCLDSISSQVFKNFEVIIVDDGSTDESSSITAAWVEEHRQMQITFVSQENKGYVVASNVALSQCRGKYIVCVDADDWIAPNLLSSIAATVFHRDVDIVSFGYVVVSSDESYRGSFGSDKSEPLFFRGKNSAVEMHRYVTSHVNVSNPWVSHTKNAVLRGAIGNLTLSGPANGADTRLMGKVLLSCHSFCCIPGDFYYVRSLPTSVSHVGRKLTVFKENLMVSLDEGPFYLAAAQKEQFPFLGCFYGLFLSFRRYLLAGAAQHNLDRVLVRRAASFLRKHHKVFLNGNQPKNRITQYLWAWFPVLLARVRLNAGEETEEAGKG